MSLTTGSCLRRSFLALGVLGSVSGYAQTSGKKRVLRFSFSRAKEDPRTQWLIAVYTELLARLDMQFEFVDVPPGRGTAMVLNGFLDGELGRTAVYAELFPGLLPLKEPNNQVQFAVYGMKHMAGFPGWQAARQQGARCEYRLGIHELKRLLENEIQSQLVSSIPSIEQGLRRLQLSRTDYYFDVKEAIDDFFRFKRGSEELQAANRPTELGVVFNTTGHAYLRADHADLVLPMSNMLKKMKAEGLVSRMLTEALSVAELNMSR